MKNQLFKRRAGVARGVVVASSWLAGGQRTAGGRMLDEDEFARAFSVEQRRVERSHKLLLLVLLDASKVLEAADGDDRISDVLSTIALSTRETDIVGWYKEGSIISIIFTEIDQSEKGLVEKAVRARIAERLGACLGPARAERIPITLRFYPEDWTPGAPDASRNGHTETALFPNGDPRRARHALKRVLDVTGSVLALVALSPLLGVIAVLIKLTSKGPVLFRQTRIGQRGQPFAFLKFRSMHVVNDQSIHKDFVRKLIQGNSASRRGAVYKIKDDPRVTRVGRFLRATSLDELPQFWNVLKGEMSLVGPRPAIPYEVECYDVWHRRRVLEVKPGITGLWQVYGRSRTTFDEMVRLDIRYATTWSIWLDLKILCKTPQAVLSSEGAY